MIRRSIGRFWPLLAVGGVLWLAFSHFRGLPPSSELKPGPMVLLKVQALGDLHTARYHYENVFEYWTSKEPAGWAQTIGLGGLVSSATKNKALASLSGRVEAGVDLSKAKLVSEEPLVLELPQPKVYEPNLDVKVHHTWPGLFWDDRNIGLKAASGMKSRLRAAAIRQGILDEARKNAAKQVGDLLTTAGLPAAQIVFPDGPAS